jgi:hypothetical protein
MTQADFIEEIKRLPVVDRIALIEAISRSLREDLQPDSGASRTARPSAGEPTGADVSGGDESPLSAHLRGVLKFEGAPPNDEEVRNLIADSVLERHS